jgi:GT2 family glycosyltransferase
MTLAAARLDLVTVIIVAFNSERALKGSLPRLARVRHLIVVDNASSDGTRDCVRSLAPQAELIESPRNLGFGRANNLALERVRTPFALLLNPDCLFDEEAVLDLLRAAERYPDATLLSPQLHAADGRPEVCYKNVYWRHHRHAPYREADGDLCSDFLTGAALLLRMQSLRPLGFFDEWFFLYYEDDDLCLKVRRAGQSLVLVPGARMTHAVGQSSKSNAGVRFRIDYHKTLSRIYIDRKYRGTAIAVAGALMALVSDLLKLPLFLLILNRRMIVRSVARIAGVVMAPVRIHQPHAGGAGA